jgi:hypothetical protein
MVLKQDERFIGNHPGIGQTPLNYIELQLKHNGALRVYGIELHAGFHGDQHGDSSHIIMCTGSIQDEMRRARSHGEENR